MKKQQIRTYFLIGKTLPVNKKGTKFINIIVLLGFLLSIAWQLFFYPKTFVDIRLVLLLLFIPSLILTPFFYKKLLKICGYVTSIKDNIKYNILMPLLGYLLIMIPIGNVIVFSFLCGNYMFAQSETKTLFLQPENITESHSRGTYSKYSHIDITYNGITKRINFGKKPIEEIDGKLLELNISKGFFGFDIINKRKFVEKDTLLGF